MKKYLIIGAAVFVAFLKVFYLGFSKAKDQFKAKAEQTKSKSYENLIKTQKENKEDLKNVKAKLDNNDFSSFNDN